MRRSWGCIGSLAALAALAMPVPASAQSGGPDAFGYEFSPASFDFVALDLVGGTPLGLGDDEEADVTLPWAFPFYGVDYSEITVSANGGVRFGAGGEVAYANTCLPDNGSTTVDIAVFWDDLNPAEGGEVRTWYDSSLDRFIVSWEAVPHYIAIAVGRCAYTRCVHGLLQSHAAESRG